MEDPTRKTILLAEDDDSMRRLLEVILGKAGYDVLPAEDGLQAFEISLENEIDALVADAVMPNMSGYDLCRVVKNERDVPVIILSGLNKENDEPDGCPADAFLTKSPQIKEDLIAALEDLL